MTSYPLSIALVHHPVRNKNGDTITAADFARNCRRLQGEPA